MTGFAVAVLLAGCSTVRPDSADAKKGGGLFPTQIHGYRLALPDNDGERNLTIDTKGKNLQQAETYIRETLNGKQDSGKKDPEDDKVVMFLTPFLSGEVFDLVDNNWFKRQQEKPV